MTRIIADFGRNEVDFPSKLDGKKVDIPQKLLAFDLEAWERIGPGPEQDGAIYRKGISIISVVRLTTDDGWLSSKFEGPPTFFHDGAPNKMSRESARLFLKFIAKMTKDGYKLVTHNGTGYDYRVLANESGWPNICEQLALQSFDLAFQMLCGFGFMIGLEATALGFHLGQKTADVSGLDVPELWQRGEVEKVCEYVGNDSRLTALILAEIFKERRVRWVSRKGRPNSRLLIPKPVADIMEEPAAEVPWPDSPFVKSNVISWMKF